MSIYILPVRVYYEDTDHGGVVYYANYLKFMERSRTEFLRDRGFEQDVLINENDLIFAVRRVEADYLQPAKFNDSLLVTAQVVNHSRVKIQFKQKVYRASAELIMQAASKEQAADKVQSAGKEQITDNCTLLCEAEITIVSLSASQMKPKRMPKNILEELMCER